MYEHCSSLCVWRYTKAPIEDFICFINYKWGNVPQRLIPWHDETQFFCPQWTKGDECRPVRSRGVSPSSHRRTFLMSSTTVSPPGSTLVPTIAQATEGAVRQIRPLVRFTVSVMITGKEKPATFHTARITVAAQIMAIVIWLVRSSVSAMTAGKVRDLINQVYFTSHKQWWGLY